METTRQLMALGTGIGIYVDDMACYVDNFTEQATGDILVQFTNIEDRKVHEQAVRFEDLDAEMWDVEL